MIYYTEFRKAIRKIRKGARDSDIEKLFQKIDRDGHGSIDKREFKKAFIGIENKKELTKKEIKKAKGLIAEFQEACTKKDRTADEVFERLDSESKESFTVKEWKKVVKKYLKHAKDSDIEDAFDYMDKDNNRKLTYKNFKNVFSSKRVSLLEEVITILKAKNLTIR